MDLISMLPSYWPQSPKWGRTPTPGLPYPTQPVHPLTALNTPFLAPPYPSTIPWLHQVCHQERPLCSHPLLWMFPHLLGVTANSMSHRLGHGLLWHPLFSSPTPSASGLGVRYVSSFLHPKHTVPLRYKSLDTQAPSPFYNYPLYSRTLLLFPRTFSLWSIFPLVTSLIELRDFMCIN